MRDYYTAYVSARVEKTQEHLDSEGAKGAEGSYAPFAPSVDYECSENFPADLHRSVLNEDGPGTDLFEERVAVMMYDGGLAEEEAFQFVTRNQRLTKRLS